MELGHSFGTGIWYSRGIRVTGVRAQVCYAEDSCVGTRNLEGDSSAMESEAGDITVLLRKWKAGDQEACDQLMPHVYPHLHKVAAAYLRREPGDHTLQPTALVHEP